MPAARRAERPFEPELEPLDLGAAQRRAARALGGRGGGE
ncbi:hypothetical protein DB32_007598 [Sandaracinus amylolyticus]|uniref:Uncharacterized protein n=1 Tax=Sandaracinus amylolyticus TaxID=927083 RepID=A0A0F6SHH4_9BACT|nr:hypothetical protein DB32_007598 [Sandaracinus amylolyticus]